MLPGPVIEANTGDTVIVHVNNYLHEGQGIRKYIFSCKGDVMPPLSLTSNSDWHGLRQNGTALMDGVPGITQASILGEDRESI